MKLTIEATDVLTEMDGVPVRVWNGTTENGTPCEVYVHRIGCSTCRSVCGGRRVARIESSRTKLAAWYRTRRAVRLVQHRLMRRYAN